MDVVDEKEEEVLILTKKAVKETDEDVCFKCGRVKKVFISGGSVSGTSEITECNC